jgi:hypothetical protein
VAVLAGTIIPPTLITFCEGIVEKLLPVIVIVVSSGPLNGVIEVICGQLTTAKFERLSLLIKLGFVDITRIR